MSSQFDFETEDSIIELKTGMNSMRDLRGTLLGLVYESQSKSEKHLILALMGTRITFERLMEEWVQLQQVLSADIVERISIVIVDDAGNLQSVPEMLSSQAFTDIQHLIRQQHSQSNKPLPRIKYHPEIAKLLLLQWLDHNDYMTSKHLASMAGCSYRTVANTLKRLEPWLDRRTDNQFRLSGFPRQEWEKLITGQDEDRYTQRYTDTSGAPRSIETLLDRLLQQQRKDIAVGGVIGAREHDPELDLIGIPRLDLTVHCPSGYLNEDFIKAMDPALVLTTEHDSTATVIIHVLRRQQSLFRLSDSNDLPIADPIECALDLNSAGLESQANDLLRSLKPEVAI